MLRVLPGFGNKPETPEINEGRGQPAALRSGVGFQPSSLPAAGGCFSALKEAPAHRNPLRRPPTMSVGGHKGSERHFSSKAGTQGPRTSAEDEKKESRVMGRRTVCRLP